MAFRNRWCNQQATGVWIPAFAGMTGRKLANHLNWNATRAALTCALTLQTAIPHPGLEQGVAVEKGARQGVVVGGDRDDGASRQPVYDVDGAHIEPVAAE